MLGAGLLLAAAAATGGTDFGIRQVASEPAASTSRSPVSVRPIFDSLSRSGLRGSPTARRVNIPAIVAIGSAWGRVTSTYRSPQHNRRVGGVRNSFHLSGRAVDIARRPGVRHADIAAAYRNAGFHLAESLDEGDHSHFAFGSAGHGAVVFAAQASTGQSASGTQWKIVTAPR